jgi:Entner-Doudoroff aldolase
MNSCDNTVNAILKHRLSAIIRTTDEDLARQAMTAAVRGGFRIVEFTMTTPGALKLIEEFSEKDDLIVGAGTVLTKDDARDAVSAGARFLVSPIFDPVIVAEAAILDAASIPGTQTPTEMEFAHRSGADFVKLFPAPGIPVQEFIQAVLGPLPHLRIYPTAGVSSENVAAVLRAGAAGAGFVRSLFQPELMKTKDTNAIEQKAVEIIRSAGL